MPGFVQVMEFDSTNIEGLEDVSNRMHEEIGSDVPTSKATVTSDRERPGHFVVIVEFESYDEAMKLSNDPRMAKYAEEMNALADGPIKYYNLDVRSVM